jgi:serine protease
VSKFRRSFAVLISAVVTASVLIPAQAANAAGTPASPVRSLKVVDAWSSASPRTAQAKLTWTKPSSTYGYSIVGYRIEKSYDTATWVTVVSNTKSTVTSKTISSDLKIGITNYFRVKAITKKGSTTATGSASAVVGKSLTAAPLNPVLLGLNELVTYTDSYKPYWLPQTPSQAGSAKPSYVVTASSSGVTAATCTSETNSCELTGLTANTPYKLSLTVKNSRGSASNMDSFKASDPELSRQWYLNEIGGISAARAWTATRGSSKVVVAVLDSGITVHPELKDQLVAGYDFVSDAAKSGDGDGIDSDPTDPGDWDQTCYTATPNDKNCWSSWHGTHVAGIIAAKQDTTGITGIAPGVKIQPVRVLGAGGEGAALDLAVAIMWSAGFTPTEISQSLQTNGRLDISGLPTNKTPAKVINLSMAGPGICPGVVQAAIENAQNKGVMLVSAAGNGNENNIPQSNVGFYPTNCYGPISVGASGFGADAAFYSNYDVDISAPGGDQRVASNAAVANSGMIYSTSNGGATSPENSTYRYEMGTSMAAPVVSGILALMYSLRPNATRDQVWTALRDSALPFKTGGICALAPGRCGSGIANAANALRALIAITG